MSSAPVQRKAKIADDSGDSTLATRASACEHCGDSLSGLKVVRKSIGQQMRSFCCQGCAFIAEQLALATASSRDRAALEAVVAGAVAPRIEAAAAATLKHAQVEVQGMVCAACGLLIEHRLRREPGFVSAHVDFGARRAYLAFDPRQASVARAEELIEHAGYHTHRSAHDERRAQRVDLLRLLLAWLAMMQVMMLAVPAYVAAPGDIPADIEQLLRIAQLILTVPVVLFSAAPIWRAAASQLRVRAIGMDLPIALGLGAAFTASAWATLAASGPVYFDSVTMFVALVLGVRWLQARALAKAYSHIDAAHRMSGMSARRLRAFPGSMVGDTVAAEQLVPGDHVLVPAGELVPADGLVRNGASTVSQAWLTGESTPIEKAEGAPVLAGSMNVEQPLVVEVTRAGEATSLAALRRLVDDAGRQRPRIVDVASRVAVWFLWAVLAITALTVTGWMMVDPAQALPNAVAVLVATCPCALSLAAPAALSAVQSALAERGVLTARSAALEQLARANVLACDKTGTLTEPDPVLARVVPLRSVEADTVLSAAAALESLSVHPFARAIVGAARARQLPVPAAQDGLVEAAAGIEATVQGVRLRIGKPEYALGLVTVDPQPRAARLLRRMDREQLQAASVVVLADNEGPLALFAFGESLRAGARGLIDKMRRAGVEPVLVSGDRREPVQRVARELGIAADGQASAFAHQTPESKRQLIAQLQGDGAVVAMLGDGMNDAPVIAQADVSIALASGSQLAQARADFIVLRPRLDDVGHAFDLARKGMRIVRENLLWAFAYNVGIIPLAAFGYVTPAVAAVGMAASSALVVGNALRARRP
jgi:Cu2+-exporting ATPase